MIAAINSFTDLMPGFSQGITQVHDTLLIIAEMICFAGLAILALRHVDSADVMWGIFRLITVVILIVNIKPISNDIIQVVNAVTESAGFNITTNVLADYQTALATKYSATFAQPGNSNPWQFLMGLAEAPGIVILGTMVYFLSIVAATLMFGMSGLQQILLALEIATSPVWLAAFMVPALRGLATKAATGLVALCCWGFGFRIVDLLIKGMLDLGVNTTNNVQIGGANAIGGSFGWFIAIMMTALIGYPLSAFFIGRSIVTTGGHGLTAMIPAMVGGGLAFGARAGAPMSVPAAASAANSMAGTAARSYRNYATRS